MKLSHVSYFAASTAAATSTYPTCTSTKALLTVLVSARAAPNDSFASPNLGYSELYTLQAGFWDRFLYPNNIKERDSINSTIFSEDVRSPQHLN